MRQSVFVIANMDCPTEEALIRKRLAALPGVDELRFDLMARRLTVGHTLADERPILDALRAATLNGAMRLGRPDLGLVAPGRRADLPAIGKGNRSRTIPRCHE